MRFFEAFKKFVDELSLANSPEYLEIAKDRKAGAQAIILLAKGFNANAG
jgi:hypothetical protein